MFINFDSFLNIWGQPSRTTSQLIIDKINDSKLSIPQSVNQIRFYDKSQSNEITVNNNNNNNKKRTLTQTELLDNCDSVSIPSEFIDLITNEIMVLPVLLPSGKSIDKSTLDKYLANRRNGVEVWIC
jgi:U-box domain-containing protein 5